MMDTPYDLTDHEYRDENKYDLCLDNVLEHIEEIKPYIKEHGIDIDDPFFEQYNLTTLDLLAAKHHFLPTNNNKRNFLNELWKL